MYKDCRFSLRYWAHLLLKNEGERDGGHLFYMLNNKIPDFSL